MGMQTQSSPEDIEISLLVEGIYRRSGYDFRNYAPASRNRRILDFVRQEGLASVSALLGKTLYDEDCLMRLVEALTVQTTAMFRDPSFYLALRRQAVPILRDYALIRLWVAGCSTGEEAYSIAILMQEEGLYDKTRIYATDVNPAAVKQAGTGIFPLTALRDYTANYIQSGGKREFSELYTAQYDHAILQSGLRRNMVFSAHNLVTDGSFNEFHLILCRNVLIYFNLELQRRVHKLIYDSLTTGGLLCLGDKENVRFSSLEQRYEALDAANKIYRKIS